MSGAVLEAPAFVAGLDDVAVMGQAIEQGGGHFGIAKDARPFAEVEVGGDDDRGLLIEMADQVEQELPATLGKGEIAKLVEDDEVQAGKPVGDPALALGPDLTLELVDEVDHLEEPAARAVADARAGDRDGELPVPVPPISTQLR